MRRIPLGLIKCSVQTSSETAYVAVLALSSRDALLSSITRSDQKLRSSLPPVFAALRGNGFLGIQTPKTGPLPFSSLPASGHQSYFLLSVESHRFCLFFKLFRNVIVSLKGFFFLVLTCMREHSKITSLIILGLQLAAFFH